MQSHRSGPRVRQIRRRVWRKHSTRALELGLNLVFPPVCACCQTAINELLQPPLCGDCRQAIVDTRCYCPRCGTRAPADVPAGECPHCKGTKFRFSGVVRLGTYQDLLRRAVLRIKRPGERGLAEALGAARGDRRNAAGKLRAGGCRAGAHALVAQNLAWHEQPPDDRPPPGHAAWRSVARRATRPLPSHGSPGESLAESAPRQRAWRISCRFTPRPAGRPRVARRRHHDHRCHAERSSQDAVGGRRRGGHGGRVGPR